MKTSFFYFCPVFIIVISLCIQYGLPAVPPRDASISDSLRIIKGSVASKGQFPYQAGIYSDWAGFCGGSLISRRWVLTAGHCVHGHLLWVVYLGTQNFMEPHEKGRMVFPTREAILHEDYDFPSSDIALLRLRRPAALSDTVRPVPLVSRKSPSFVGEEAIISGFGKVHDEPAVISPVLRYTTLQVLNTSVCSETFSYPMPDDILCLQGEGISSVCQFQLFWGVLACYDWRPDDIRTVVQPLTGPAIFPLPPTDPNHPNDGADLGDSGGPLVVQNETGASVQIGITSFVYKTSCEMGLPSGFASVKYFVPWIAKMTGIPFE